MKKELVVQEGYVLEEETLLTVLKTSLFFNGDGFAVYDCNGKLVFRFDSYGPRAHDKDELVLMDSDGRSLLTLRRKKPSLHQRWEGFKGDGEKRLFSVKRSSIMGGWRSSVAVEVYDNAGVEYRIQGCFPHRCCKVFNASKELVGEIRRKVDPTTSVLLGNDVFSLCVKPGFDAAFAMGLVLVLDQINGQNYFHDTTVDPAVHPSPAPAAAVQDPVPV